VAELIAVSNNLDKTMADNLTFPLGAAALLSTDDVLGVQVLRTKIQIGIDGQAQDVSVEQPMPVSMVGSLTVSSLPAVTVSSLPAVTVAELPPVTVEEPLSISIDQIRTEFPSLDIGSMPAVKLTTSTSGGANVYRRVGLSSTGLLIRGSATTVYGWHLANISAATVFVKLYNMATAPTVGTHTPHMTIFVPSSQAVQVSVPQGVAFGTGLGIGATTGMLDNNTTAPSANSVLANIFYA
jgi:hypothetical protein